MKLDTNLSTQIYDRNWVSPSVAEQAKPGNQTLAPPHLVAAFLLYKEDFHIPRPLSHSLFTPNDRPNSGQHLGSRLLQQ